MLAMPLELAIEFAAMENCSQSIFLGETTISAGQFTASVPF
jgi:hypothetical protein